MIDTMDDVKEKCVICEKEDDPTAFNYTEMGPVCLGDGLSDECWQAYRSQKEHNEASEEEAWEGSSCLSVERETT